MLLVDDVGIEPQSYGTDPALLEELRGAWPPPEPPADEDGYVPASVAGLRPAAAIRLSDRLGVALASIDGTDRDELSVAGLVRDAGYEPVDLGGTAGCEAMEAPRRDGAVYGEEYRLPEAERVVAAVRAGRPIPPTPRYTS